MFWESHNPTQGMRQGNDIGSQYRSAIFWRSPEQKAAAEASLAAYQQQLTQAGYGTITTEIVQAPEFYFAEGYHQQYLADTKNPYGYCPDHGTGVSCPIGVGVRPESAYKKARQVGAHSGSRITIGSLAATGPHDIALALVAAGEGT